MNETYEPTLEINKTSKSEQIRFDLKTIETLLSKFRDIDEHPNETGKQALVKYLFKTEKIKNFLAEHGVIATDTLPNIISKLDEAAAILEHEKNFFWPEEEESQAVVANDNEEVRDQRMSIQDQLNELYRLNNEALNEEERIRSAQAFLEIFAAEREENERVEVARTKGGEVEVLFEQDVEDAEFLREVAHDIRETERRIAEYDKMLETAPRANKKPLRERLFGGGSAEPETDAIMDSEGIAAKKMRAEIALADKIAAAEAREAKLQARLEEKSQALRSPLLVSGIDAFDGTWGELLQELRMRVKQAEESVEADFRSREQEIATLESKRDELERSEKAA